MTDYEKVIRLRDRLKLPQDLSKPVAALDVYLGTLHKECEEDDRERLRYFRMSKTRQENAIIEERKAVICKQEILEDSNIVVEKRVGYKVTCPWCSYNWVWHGKKIDSLSPVVVSQVRKTRPIYVQYYL